MHFIDSVQRTMMNTIGYLKTLLFGALFFAMVPFVASAADFTITASADLGGSITPSGAVAVVASSTQSFTITPDTGYHIADVLVDSVSAGTVTSYDFTDVQADHTIQASFAIDQFSITATAGSGGSISPSSPTVDYGTDQTFTITPSTGYEVATLAIDGTPDVATTTYTFSNVTTTHTIDVTFSLLAVPPTTHDLVATAGANGTIAPLGTTTVIEGSSQTFTITPSAGYEVATLTIDGISTFATTSYTFANVIAGHTIDVSFQSIVVAPTMHSILAVVGSHGTITPDGLSTILEGDSASFTLTPDAGYDVATLTVDGISVTATTSYTFANVTADHTITATFVALHTLIATDGANGSVTPVATTTVTEGATVTYAVTPDAGYGILALTIDGVTTTPASTYTFTNVMADHTITATFIALHTITVTGGVNGTVTNVGTTTVVDGTDFTVTITPNTNYVIGEVIIDGLSVATATAYTLTNVTTNHSIDVTFVALYTISATTSVGGTMTPSGTITITEGTTQTISIAPDAGYVVLTLIVDSIPVATSTTYTFTNVTNNHSMYASFAHLYDIVAVTGLNGVISPVGTSTVVEGSSPLYTITPDVGYAIDALVIDGVTTTPASTYTFTNVSANHTIAATFIALHTVTVTGGVNGIVTNTGTSTVTEGSDFTVTITPNAGYAINTVTIDGVPTTTANTYTLTGVASDHTIVVTFIALHTITASAGAYGTITPNGVSTVTEGSNQTFTITPDAGYMVSALIVDSIPVATSTSYTFTSVTGEHSVFATFVPIFSIIATSNAQGTVTPAGTSVVVGGTDQVYTFVPNAGYVVDTLVVDGVATTAVSTYTFVNVQASHTIDVTFIALYDLVATAGANGTISPLGTTTVTEGSTQIFTITPSAGYDVSTLTIDGVGVATSTSYSFATVTAPHTIEATFVALHSVTVTAGANGSVTNQGTSTVTDGTNFTITITPNFGYAINVVTIDGTPTTTAPTYTLSGVIADHTIDVTFIAIHDLVATAGANGTISPLGTTTVTEGTTQTFTITPNLGYIVNALTIDGTPVATSTTYSFATVTASHTIDVTFVAIHTIVTTAGPNGNISPVGSTTVVDGMNQTFTITPAPGYMIATLTIDGATTTATTSHTFVNVQGDHTIDVTFAILPTHLILATAGANGNISPSGTTSVTQWTNQTFTITPAFGYVVDILTVDGATTTPAGSYTFVNVQAAHTIDVTFIQLSTHNITATAGGNGTISPNGTTTVYDTYNQTFTFTPAFGYGVNTVTVDGATTVPAQSYTFMNVQGNHTIAVTFAQLPIHTITASIAINGAVTPSGATSVYETYNQTYTITPSYGYSVATLIIDGTSVATTSTTYTFTNVLTDHTLGATFTLLPAYVIGATAGPNGTISPLGATLVYQGNTQTYTITPAFGYGIGTLTIDGATTTATTTYTFNTIATNHLIDVTFVVLPTYTFTATAGSGGSISSVGTTSVYQTYSQTYTITPNLGYGIGTVTIDGSTTTATTTYTFTNVSGPHTIDVTFVALPAYTVFVGVATNGTVSPLGTTTVFLGDSLTITLSPVSGYEVATLVVDGVSVATATSYTFTNISASHTVNATFVEIPSITTTITTTHHGSSGGSSRKSSKNSTSTTTNSGGLGIDVTIDGPFVDVNGTPIIESNLVPWLAGQTGGGFGASTAFASDVDGITGTTLNSSISGGIKLIDEDGLVVTTEEKTAKTVSSIKDIRVAYFIVLFITAILGILLYGYRRYKNLNHIQS
jgi:hypothetical protein